MCLLSDSRTNERTNRIGQAAERVDWNISTESESDQTQIGGRRRQGGGDIVAPIGVGSGAAGAALAAPIFWLVAVFGPRFLNIQVVCCITQTQKIAYRVVHVSSKFQ